MAIIARARAMRKALTPSEARLWVALRELRTQGLHFRRQAPLRGYYLDFFCWARGVIVEVDGGSHLYEDRARQDRVRDAVFAREGLITLRYDNLMVRDQLAQVIEDVRGRCLARPTRSPLRGDHPPPQGEGEDFS
ncbi:endonuclease domain-containing protein [Brevundimonas sp. TWP1-2-1b1]|uniref:endonuclease domain-containing protein n=1 Tax=unclassified Brevundimonas TaxID=2622653 RepID=UPI003CFA8918